LPPRFSWVDQRLVQARHLDRLDVYAAALYLFLITVANAKGLSWYGDEVIAKRLSMDSERLRQARLMLVQTSLLAFADGVYQVLALDGPSQPQSGTLAAPPVMSELKPEAITPAASVTARSQVKQPPTPVSAMDTPCDPATARQHLAAIHALLGQRP
jgi:hypothetical protein